MDKQTNKPQVAGLMLNSVYPNQLNNDDKTQEQLKEIKKEISDLNSKTLLLNNNLKTLSNNDININGQVDKIEEAITALQSNTQVINKPMTIGVDKWEVNGIEEAITLINQLISGYGAGSEERVQTAYSAFELIQPPNLIVNLESNSQGEFDPTASFPSLPQHRRVVEMGVSGILPLEYGGTGINVLMGQKMYRTEGEYIGTGDGNFNRFYYAANKTEGLRNQLTPCLLTIKKHKPNTNDSELFVFTKKKDNTEELSIIPNVKTMLGWLWGHLKDGEYTGNAFIRFYIEPDDEYGVSEEDQSKAVFNEKGVKYSYSILSHYTD